MQVFRPIAPKQAASPLVLQPQFPCCLLPFSIRTSLCPFSAAHSSWRILSRRQGMQFAWPALLPNTLFMSKCQNVRKTPRTGNIEAKRSSNKQIDARRAVHATDIFVLAASAQGETNRKDDGGRSANSRTVEWPLTVFLLTALCLYHYAL